jgi:hypothetical protein
LHGDECGEGFRVGLAFLHDETTVGQEIVALRVIKLSRPERLTVNGFAYASLILGGID